jgi:hypothetical protein
VKLKNNSAVATIIQNNLENANAILGPFSKQLLQLLSMKNVPVISPLKDVGNPYANLYRPYQQMK